MSVGRKLILELSSGAHRQLKIRKMRSRPWDKEKGQMGGGYLQGRDAV